MPKYHIIDDNGSDWGFVVIKAQEFTSLQNSFESIPERTWFTFLVILVATTGILNFLGQVNGAISASVGILVASILTGIKSWRGHIIPQEKSETLRIEAEFTDPLSGVIYRDEIDNPDIDKDSLLRLCKAIRDNNLEWVGRIQARLFANVKRTQHTLIRREFMKVGYLNVNNKLCYRGKRFVREVIGV